MDFEIKSAFKPTGDQPEAIKQIVTSINNDEKFQTLLGVTGSGKTEIYIKLIEHYINEGKSCLILVPEIVPHFLHPHPCKWLDARCSNSPCIGQMIITFLSDWV